MLVECYDEKGAEVYEIIIKQIFQDLVLGASVDDLKAYVNPDDPVFVLAIKMRKTSKAIAFEDVANLTYMKDDDKTMILIDNDASLWPCMYCMKPFFAGEIVCGYYFPQCHGIKKVFQGLPFEVIFWYSFTV